MELEHLKLIVELVGSTTTTAAGVAAAYILAKAMLPLAWVLVALIICRTIRQIWSAVAGITTIGELLGVQNLWSVCAVNRVIAAVVKLKEQKRD